MLEAAPHRGSASQVERVGPAAIGICYDPGEPNATMARVGDHVAAFVGALDNHSDIRSSLAHERVQPSEPSVAETLLAAYRVWGADFVAKLRGSYAGVVFDGRDAICFRDHFGTRGLFYHDGGRGFYAASEIKQVLAGAPIPPRPDLDHLHRSIFGSVQRSTPFLGVERVPERCALHATRESGVAMERYWDPDPRVESATLTLEQAVEGTVEALGRAVRRMLTGSDVILLSGGLDSPALAAFGTGPRAASLPLQALTAVYPSTPSVDESEWTAMAARHLGIPLHRYEAKARAMDDVDAWVRLVDAPVVTLSMPESVEAYREARALGARTILTGEIAEMLFESRAGLLSHLLWRGRVRCAARLLGQQKRAGRGRRSLVRDLARATLPERLLPAGLRPPAHPRLAGLPAWVDAGTLLSYDDETSSRREGVRDRWRNGQTAPFRGPSTGFEADEICAESCGVEVRRPFADVDLWEFVLSLPAEVKFPDVESKPLLRRAMRGILPDALIDRRDKTYFDEFHLSDADFGTLRRRLADPRRRLDGIDYDRLDERLSRHEMTMYELSWAQNVARIHAFLDQW